MKQFSLFILILLTGFYANSQDLIFKMNQYGTSVKNHDGRFDESVVKSGDVLITMQDKVVKVYDDFNTSIVLEKMSNQNNNIKRLYTQVWKGADDKKTPVQFKFTVNVDSKEAMVEVVYKDYKNYYFGRYNYGNMAEDAKKEPGSAKALWKYTALLSMNLHIQHYNLLHRLLLV